MPAIEDIASLQARSRLVHSKLVKAAYTVMALGGVSKDWGKIYAIHQLNLAINTQIRAADYTSDITLSLYKSLQCFVGSQFIDPVPLNPYAQIPNTVIQVVNPGISQPPVPEIPYEWFDPATQQEDGGRYIYYKAAWKGLNPVLSFISPADIALSEGTDYTLIFSGGISLLPGGNKPFIYPLEKLRAVSYAPA